MQHGLIERRMHLEACASASLRLGSTRAGRRQLAWSGLRSPPRSRNALPALPCMRHVWD